MRESEYEANLELARSIQRAGHVQVRKPAPREDCTLVIVVTFALGLACGAVLGILLAFGV